MFRSTVVQRIVPGLALAAAAFYAGATGMAGPGPAVAHAQAAASAPFVQGLGPQGFGFYAAPGAAAAPAAPRLAVPAQTRPAGRSVGPGVRNWATGNRVPSHRPWLRSRS